jgi:hypothetical protein
MAEQYTYQQLRELNVAQLREVAQGLEHEAVQGYTQMNKEHLLAAICHALNLDMHVHHEVVGIDKSGVKNRIKQLKKDRDAAIQAGDHEQLKKVRRQIHQMKRRIHKATV